LSVRLGVSAAGNVIVGAGSELVGTVAGQILQVAGRAYKSDGNVNWDIVSDARVKEDVRDLDVGLAKLRKVRPVRFRYNGRAGTPAGVEAIGVIAQEIESVFPETIHAAASGVAGEGGLEDLKVFNSSPLTFVLINAVKELADRVERLEKALADSSSKGSTRSGSRNTPKSP
jgi:Chaperone of endosialidase